MTTEESVVPQRRENSLKRQLNITKLALEQKKNRTWSKVFFDLGLPEANDSEQRLLTRHQLLQDSAIAAFKERTDCAKVPRAFLEVVTCEKVGRVYSLTLTDCEGNDQI